MTIEEVLRRIADNSYPFKCFLSTPNWNSSESCDAFFRLCIECLFDTLEHALLILEDSNRPLQGDELLSLVAALDAMASHPLEMSSRTCPSKLLTISRGCSDAAVNAMAESAAFWLHALGLASYSPSLFPLGQIDIPPFLTHSILSRRMASLLAPLLKRAQHSSRPSPSLASFAIDELLRFNLVSLHFPTSPALSDRISSSSLLCEHFPFNFAAENFFRLGGFIFFSSLFFLAVVFFDLGASVLNGMMGVNADRSGNNSLFSLCFLEDFIDSRFCDSVLFGNETVAFEREREEATLSGPLWWMRWCVPALLWCVPCCGINRFCVPTPCDAAASLHHFLADSSTPEPFSSYKIRRATLMPYWIPTILPLCFLSGDSESHAMVNGFAVSDTLASATDAIWRSSLHVAAPAWDRFLSSMLSFMLWIYRGNRHRIDEFIPLENELTMRVIPYLESTSFRALEVSKASPAQKLLLSLEPHLRRLRSNLQSFVPTPPLTPRCG